MDEKKLNSKYSMQELLDELDIIELYQQPGNRAYIRRDYRQATGCL
ncbi:hypothetical protein HMPREF0322_03097 [Desulfitobacterium hafniense DP7]|uniref:Uncharacterized protein n=1 Tax=Desulfitobacterium hafniense DP7 TaxID=537010 RepID=G9XQ51_DESHA|nr:hypothetical protein HMPREF0322_03097 [Desulfitobacterium hafniense DP7]